VPPPARARRDSRPAARATAISAASGIGTRKTEGGYPSAHRSPSYLRCGSSTAAKEKDEDARSDSRRAARRVRRSLALPRGAEAFVAPGPSSSWTPPGRQRHGATRSWSAALDAGAIDESELAAVLAGSTGSVTACRYPGSPVRGKPIECSPNGGCPSARPLLRSAVGFASAAPVRSVAKENCDEGPH
jgi:hypothetical protein